MGRRVFSGIMLVLLVLLPILSSSSPVSASIAKWTFMVYLDADNNLDPAGVDDISEMQAVGSTSDVNIVVLFDRWYKMCGFNGSAILYIHEGWNETVWGGWSEEFELNMGDPETLKWFVQFAMTEYPAERYALVLWDHGHGWPGVCDDWTDKDHLEIDEVKMALAGLPRMNLLGFDACLMSMVEVAYSMQGTANVMVSSEEWEPWDGWPYDVILANLVKHPEWNERELGTEIVDDYIESYKQGEFAYRPWGGVYSVLVTMAAINLTSLPMLVSGIDLLAKELIANFDEYQSAITTAKDSADRYWFGLYYQGPYVDLYHFISILGRVEKKLTEMTKPILNTWSDVVIATKTYSRVHQNALGLTIYFPRHEWLFYNPKEYSKISFSTDTAWDDLLATYFLYTAPPQRPRGLSASTFLT